MPAGYTRAKRAEKAQLGRDKKRDLNNMSPELYEELLAVFRKHGGPCKDVYAELGCLSSRGKRLFKRPYPKLGLPAMADRLAEEEVEIRAARRRKEEGLPEKVPLPSADELVADETRAVVIADGEARRLQEMVRREDERRRARADAIEARAEEALLLSLQRRNAIALNGITAQLMRGAVSLAGLIERELQEVAAGTSEVSLSQKLQLIRSAASVARFNSEASMLAVKSERLVLGQPIETTPEITADDGSLDQAVDWIERAAKAVERAKSRGLLKSSNEAAE